MTSLGRRFSRQYLPLTTAFSSMKCKRSLHTSVTRVVATMRGEILVVSIGGQLGSMWVFLFRPHTVVLIKLINDVKYIFVSAVSFFFLLLGHVALVAQRPIVAKLSRGRSVGPYTYVRTSVGLSSALWKNGGSDPDAVWHHRSDRSKDEAVNGVLGSVHWKVYFWGRIWGAPL